MSNRLKFTTLSCLKILFFILTSFLLYGFFVITQNLASLHRNGCCPCSSAASKQCIDKPVSLGKESEEALRTPSSISCSHAAREEPESKKNVSAALRKLSKNIGSSSASKDNPEGLTLKKDDSAPSKESSKDLGLLSALKDKSGLTLKKNAFETSEEPSQIPCSSLRKHCQEVIDPTKNVTESKEKPSNDVSPVPIFFITPTYPRPEQMPDVTRLANTLKLVPNLHWILVEDAKELNPRILEYLNYLNLSYTYMLAGRQREGKEARGLPGRIAAVEWLKSNDVSEGVVYFGDDDNSYDIRVFDEMRSTVNISMWPVGLVTHFGVSTPVIRNGKVTDFYDGWLAKRTFPVDMAGFAMSVPMLYRGKLDKAYGAGYAETKFLRTLNITKDDIEPKAQNCTKIYVWHTKTVKNKNATKVDLKKWNGTSTNLETIAKLLY